MKNFPLMTTLTFVVFITSLQLLPVKAAAVSVVELPEITGQVTSDLTGTAVATGDINGERWL